jgi:hypothetical protein
MVPVTALLTAIQRQDFATLNDLIEYDGMAEAHLTHEEAVALWEAGWQEWLGGDWESENESWDPQASLHTPQLWRITLGVFLRLLHARCPALPGVPTWTEIWDGEEE